MCKNQKYRTFREVYNIKNKTNDIFEDFYSCEELRKFYENANIFDKKDFIEL